MPRVDGGRPAGQKVRQEKDENRLGKLRGLDADGPDPEPPLGLRIGDRRDAADRLGRRIVAEHDLLARHRIIGEHALAVGGRLQGQQLQRFRRELCQGALAAQAAQLKGDRASVRRIFEAMTKEAETEALGLRGLFFEARQEGNMAAARSYAEKALKLNPRLAWASASMLQIQAVSQDWEGAAATIGQQVKSGAMAAADGNRKQAAMLANTLKIIQNWFALISMARKLRFL